MGEVLLVIGLVMIVGISVGAGMILAGERHRRSRLRLDADRRALWRWEQELLAAAEVRGCPGCHLLRRRAELQRLPSE
jgi:hypothetical protein